METKAKVLANWWSAVGDKHCHGGVYSDGAILYICVSVQTQARIEQAIGHLVTESDRSDDGMCVVMIVQSPCWPIAFDIIREIMGSLTYTDNTDKDACRIEWFATFIANTQYAWDRGRQEVGFEQ